MKEHRHHCVKGLKDGYLANAVDATDNQIAQMLRDFEHKYRGDKTGGMYQTVQWRIYKRIWRNEAHRRGLGT